MPLPDGRQWWDVDDDEVIEVVMPAEESDLLAHGLLHVGGPARPTDLLAQVIGFDGVRTMLHDGARIRRTLRAGHPRLTKRDWSRALVCTEIAFASSYYGAAGDWTNVTGLTEEHSLRTLRRVQDRLCGLRAAPLPRE